MPDVSKVTMRLVIVWGTFFSLNALGTCMVASLSNVTWATMTLQSKFLLIVIMFVNWSGTMMAFLSKIVARLETNKPIIENGGTDFFAKTLEQETIAKKATEDKSAVSIVKTTETTVKQETTPT